MYAKLIFDKGAKKDMMGKGLSLQKMVLGKLDIQMQKKETGPLFDTFEQITQNESKTWI